MPLQRTNSFSCSIIWSNMTSKRSNTNKSSNESSASSLASFYQIYQKEKWKFLLFIKSKFLFLLSPSKSYSICNKFLLFLLLLLQIITSSSSTSSSSTILAFHDENYHQHQFSPHHQNPNYHHHYHHQERPHHHPHHHHQDVSRNYSSNSSIVPKWKGNINDGDGDGGNDQSPPPSSSITTMATINNNNDDDNNNNLIIPDRQQLVPTIRSSLLSSESKWFTPMNLLSSQQQPQETMANLKEGGNYYGSSHHQTNYPHQNNHHHHYHATNNSQQHYSHPHDHHLSYHNHHHHNKRHQIHLPETLSETSPSSFSNLIRRSSSLPSFWSNNGQSFQDSHQQQPRPVEISFDGNQNKDLNKMGTVPASASQQQQHQHQPTSPSLYILPIENVTATVGRTAVLKCVTSLHGPSIMPTWLKMDENSTPTLLTLGTQTLMNEDEGKYRVTHNEHQWELYINRIQVTDRGLYMCQINAKNMISQIGYLDVYEPPVINEELTSSDTTVDELSKVSLRCATNGYPQPSVTWRRQNGKALNLGQYGGKKYAAKKWDGEYLNISQVSRDDMGAYLCIASNGVPPSVSKRIVLQVNFRPKIRVHNQLVSAYIGSDVELECRVESSPKPETMWLTGNGQRLDELMEQREKQQQKQQEEQGNSEEKIFVRSRDHNHHNHQFGEIPLATNSNRRKRPPRKKYQFDEEHDGYHTIMRLTIRHLEPIDFGSYKCIAKNNLGEKEGLVRLYEIPVPTLPPTTTTTTRRSTTKLFMMTESSKNKNGMQRQWATNDNIDSNNQYGGRSLRENQKSNIRSKSGGSRGGKGRGTGGGGDGSISLASNEDDYDGYDNDDEDSDVDMDQNSDITYLEQLYKDKVKYNRNKNQNKNGSSHSKSISTMIILMMLSMLII